MRSLLLVLVMAAGLAAQTFVDGRVFDSVTGEPVANVYITSGASAPGDPIPTTDATGHFRVEARNNQIYVQVKRNGCLDYRRIFPIEPGQAVPELRATLVPQGVISGRVLDENGLPVRGARAALHYRPVNGQRQLQLWHPGTETNELGEYRIFGLPAGRYYLGFTPESFAWGPRYSARYYPDAAENAQPVDLKAGEEIGGRDFRLSRQEGVTITGRLVRPDATTAKKGTAGVRVTLVFESAEDPDYLVSRK
jgi:hypothetical protein